MIEATDRAPRQFRVRGLHIVELDTAPHGRDWTLHRDLDLVTIAAGLPEKDRRRALAEALAAMVA